MSALSDYNTKLRQFSEAIKIKLANKDPKFFQVASEYVTVAADGVKQYDLQTLMTAAVFALYDIKTVEIFVRAKDVTATSPLFGAYANAESLISYGIKDERYVIVANQSGASIDLYIKIRVQPK